MQTRLTSVAAVVGIDGCGKSTAYRGALERLAARVPVVGIGDGVLGGAPDDGLHVRTDIPLSRSAAIIGRFAKGLSWWWPYRHLKFVELTERARIREHVLACEAPAAIVADGDPLVNVAAWAAASTYRRELTGDDERLLDVIHFLAGDRPIPWREMPYYLRHAWQLAALNRLHIARFRFPDLVVLLQIDGRVAMERIRARGRPLQKHETAAFLSELGQGYERVCRVLESRCDVPVIRIPVEQTAAQETARIVADAVYAWLPRYPVAAEVAMGVDAIDVVATTMSGSLRDQAKIVRIGPEFRVRTSRPVRVHVADTHAEARAQANAVASGDGRIIVSAGGAGTFNAVLEGSHVDGVVPPDLRLAFLRKGSADLIGKALHIPDELGPAVEAIVGGIEADDDVAADILAVEAIEPNGERQTRHILGFGGLGLFGEVPRFTETKAIKYYKGILGMLFGDYGPFFTGLTLATIYWSLNRARGRVPRTILTLDGERFPPVVWGSVIIANGDLGKDFPLGRGLSFSSGTFRVVALRYVGARRGLRQFDACRTGRVLDDPARYAAVVREVRMLTATPETPTRPFMVNVDGLRLYTSGEVRVSVSGRVQLVEGRPGPATSRPAASSPVELAGT